MSLQKRTDIELYDEKDYDRLSRLRVNYRSFQFTSEMVRKYLSHMHLVEQDYLQRVKNNKEHFLDLLEGAKMGWIIDHNVVPSLAKTIAEVLLTCVIQPYLKSAQRFYTEQNIPLFLMDVDFSFGIVEIPTAIIGASTEGEGGGKKGIDYGLINGFKHTGPIPSPATDQLYNELLQTCQYQRKLFVKDHTGETLLSSVISCLEADESSHTKETFHRKIPSYHNKTLYLEGSYFGKHAYRALYKLWKEEGFSYVFS